LKRIILCLVLFILVKSVHAQRVSSTGFFPEAQLTFSPLEKLVLTAKIETQHGMVTNTNETPANWGYYHYRTDFQGFAGTSLNPFISIAGGYQYRWDGDGDNSHRTIQQISLVQRKASYRLGHRLRTDQTFLPTEAPEFRIRYRLVAEFPLSGNRIDPGEYYLIASNEPIFEYQADSYNIENRLVCSLGYNFTKNQKLEAGLDYRADNFLDGGLRQRLWLRVGWFVNIPHEN